MRLDRLLGAAQVAQSSCSPETLLAVVHQLAELHGREWFADASKDVGRDIQSLCHIHLLQAELPRLVTSALQYVATTRSFGQRDVDVHQAVAARFDRASTLTRHQ